MSTYNKKLGIGKLGINLIKSFIDENECYFHEILHENDVGIDAFIEFTKEGENNGRCIAVQIKTGESYFNSIKSECHIPIGNHYNYWKNHSLDVYGIVCNYERKQAFWVSITRFIEKNKEAIEDGRIKTISFDIMKLNELNSKTFDTIFKQLIYGMLPRLAYEQSIDLSFSPFQEEKIMAVSLLMRTYVDKFESWDRCIDMLKEESDEELLIEIIKYLSYVPYHPDLWGDLNYSPETKEYAKKLIETVDKKTITKLLSLTENGIERGTIGQCIESLISIIPDNENILTEIVSDNYDNYIGINAFLILSYYNSKLVYEKRIYFESILGEISKTVFDFIEGFGNYELYI
jgi:hypothetical protein